MACRKNWEVKMAPNLIGDTVRSVRLMNSVKRVCRVTASIESFALFSLWSSRGTKKDCNFQSMVVWRERASRALMNFKIEPEI